MAEGLPEEKDDRDFAEEQVLEVRMFLAGLQARRPIVTYALLVVIFALFGLEELWGAASTATLARMGAEVPSLIRAGEWWRLLAPTVLHASITHVLVNAFSLWMLGSFVERLLGHSRFLILFVLSGLGGSLVAPYFASAPKFSHSVGASGAVLGLLGAATVLGLFPRGQIPALIVRDLRKNALINFGLAVFTSLRPNVDYLAHLGGAISGILLCGIGLLRPTIAMSPRTAAGWGPLEPLIRALAVVCALALATSVGAALQHGRPWQLTKPLQFQRRPLGNTGMSLEVPTLLGSVKPTKRDDGATELLFGDDLESPAVLWVRLAPVDAQLLEDSDAANGQQEKLEIDGLPARLSKFRSGGIEWHHLYQRRSRYHVTLQMALAPDAPKNLKLDVAQILQTLQDAPTP